MKYTHPAYVNETIETTDVICSSMFRTDIVDIVEKDEVTGEEKVVGQKTVISIAASNLF